MGVVDSWTGWGLCGYGLGSCLDPMTVAVAARFDGGVVCASDSSVLMGGSRLTMESIKGEQVLEGFALYAGVMSDAQKIARKAKEAFLLDIIEEEEWDEDDGADFLVVDHELNMYTVDSSGAVVKHSEYGAIGHGQDMARFGLLMNYKPNKSEQYVKTLLKTLIDSIERFDATVYGPARFEVLYAE